MYWWWMRWWEDVITILLLPFWVKKTQNHYFLTTVTLTYMARWGKDLMKSIIKSNRANPKLMCTKQVWFEYTNKCCWFVKHFIFLSNVQVLEKTLVRSNRLVRCICTTILHYMFLFIWCANVCMYLVWYVLYVSGLKCFVCIWCDMFCMYLVWHVLYVSGLLCLICIWSDKFCMHLVCYILYVCSVILRFLCIWCDIFCRYMV